MSDANLQKGRSAEKAKHVRALADAICAAEPGLNKADCTAIAVGVCMADDLERWLETACQSRLSHWEDRVEDSWDRFMERALDRTRREK